MKREVKLILGLTEKLDKLLDTKTELFFAERPFLWRSGENYDTKNLEERKKENEEGIHEVVNALNEKLDVKIPEKVIKQEELL